MSYVVVIQHISTGEERHIEHDGEWDEAADYLWSEGNYGCDCNRALFFYSWGPEAKDRECGDTEFAIPLVILANGEVIEFEAVPA